MLVKFEHECHIDSVKYEAGEEVDTESLPADWVKGALTAKFISRVKPKPAAEAVAVEPKEQSGETTESVAETKPVEGETTGGIPDDVRAKLVGIVGQ